MSDEKRRNQWDDDSAEYSSRFCDGGGAAPGAQRPLWRCGFAITQRSISSLMSRARVVH